MSFDELPEEQKAKAKACETPEELKAVCESTGLRLTDDEAVDGISGGVKEGFCPSWCAVHSAPECPALLS